MLLAQSHHTALRYVKNRSIAAGLDHDSRSAPRCTFACHRSSCCCLLLLGKYSVYRIRLHPRTISLTHAAKVSPPASYPPDLQLSHPKNDCPFFDLTQHGTATPPHDPASVPRRVRATGVLRRPAYSTLWSRTNDRLSCSSGKCAGKALQAASTKLA